MTQSRTLKVPAVAKACVTVSLGPLSVPPSPKSQRKLVPPGVEASVKVTVCPRLITVGLTEKSTLEVASTRTPM